MSDETDETNLEHLRLIRRIQNDLTQKFKPYSGKTTDGDEYDSIEEMWIAEGVVHVASSSGTSSRSGSGGVGGGGAGGWYENSHGYWQDDDKVVPATTDGMLGGFETLTERDLAASKRFVEDVFGFRSEGLKARLSSGGIGGGDVDDEGGRRRKTRCCECGAGIGRVSKGLLLPLGFEACDLVETSPRLIAAAPEYIGDPDASKCRYICMGLQDFEPKPDTYDVIWIQWVIGYLTDSDLVLFLRRAAASLRLPDGLIFLKDNVCEDLAFLVDKDDSSIARSLPYLLASVKEAGLRVVVASKGGDGGSGSGGGGGEMLRFQDDFPEDIFPVPMMALELDV